MPKFRKKPVVIEAWQFVPENYHERPEWLRGTKCISAFAEGDLPKDAFIETLEGVMRADPGDWIIRGVKGEIYPCKPDIFAATYEPAE